MTKMSNYITTESHHHNNNNNNNNNVVNKDKSFRIKHEDLNLFSKLLTRRQTTTTNKSNSNNNKSNSNNSKSNISNSNPSFRIYYADVSVPFVWESHPGTPKHRFSGSGGVVSDDSSAAFLRPPLTPPPSYFSNNNMRKNPTIRSKNRLQSLLLKITLKRAHNKSFSGDPTSSLSPLSPSSSLFSSSSSSRSSFSSPATPASFHRRSRRNRQFSGGSGSSFDKGIIDISPSSEPSAATCFGIVSKERRGMVKNVFFSIVGRRQ